MKAILNNTLALVSLFHLSAAAEPARPVATPKPAAAKVDRHFDLHDPAFARFVQGRDLVDAVRKLDADRLTDLALELAEGERVLLRPHRALSSQRLLNLAARVATEQRDLDALRRLAEVHQARGRAADAAAVATEIKRLGTALEADSALNVSAYVWSADDFARLRRHLDTLARLRLAGDAAGLDALVQSVRLDGRLPAGVRDQLLRRVEQERAAGFAQDEAAHDIRILLALAQRPHDDRAGWIADGSDRHIISADDRHGRYDRSPAFEGRQLWIDARQVSSDGRPVAIDELVRRAIDEAGRRQGDARFVRSSSEPYIVLVIVPSDASPRRLDGEQARRIQPAAPLPAVSGIIRD